MHLETIFSFSLQDVLVMYSDFSLCLLLLSKHLLVGCSTEGSLKIVYYIPFMSVRFSIFVFSFKYISTCVLTWLGNVITFLFCKDPKNTL